MAGAKQIHLVGSLVFAFFLICWNPTPIRASSSGKAHEIEFDYTKGSKLGPERWGTLKKEWAPCNGKSQSPIDIQDFRAAKVTSSLKDIKLNYKPSNATIKNEGHAIAVVWEGDAGSVNINGTDYFLKQCHWHTPSEHAINGKRYDLELHMVHRSRKNEVAVVGFLYKLGEPNPFLSKVKKELSSMINAANEKHVGKVDPRKIRRTKAVIKKNKTIIGGSGQTFYRYTGSFTTPPCTEGVTWTINKQVHTVSAAQVKLLQQAVLDYARMNARPLQPLNGRGIKLHGSYFGKKTAIPGVKN